LQTEKDLGVFLNVQKQQTHHHSREDPTDDGDKDPAQVRSSVGTSHTNEVSYENDSQFRVSSIAERPIPSPKDS
jgi:hypothetical protein